MSRKPRHMRMFARMCLCVCMCVVFIPGIASENGVFRGKLVNSQNLYFQILEVLFRWKVLERLFYIQLQNFELLTMSAKS